jgi:hypothetical protein
VVEYAFLADFDLLRDSHQDVRDRPWTNPACRVVIDHHFKLERAREEIQRLNVEIVRVVTYIRDENKFLRSKEADIMLVDPGLARQVKIHRMERGRFNARHMERFRKLASLPGFSGSIIPGTSTELGGDVHDAMDVDDAAEDSCQGGVDDTAIVAEADDDDSDDDQEDEEIEAIVIALMSLTVDAPGVVLV